MKYIYTLILFSVVFLVACQPQPQITSFEECVQAGNQVIESYPRECSANGQTFIEEITNPQVTFTECTQEQQQSEVCTLEYSPVCALVDNGVRCVTAPCASVDARTSGNSCMGCSAPAIGYYQGACEEQLFVVCKETQTGFNATEFAEQSGGICVDICPGNYDAYTTQIGVELCIEHAGVEEIEMWEVCTASSTSCNCVKAYETTTNEEIANSEYRCVPNQYAERLLFRGGQDRLNEEGERAVLIA